MNNVTLIGRLTADPELNYTNSQTAVCKFTLAVNRNGKEGADYLRIVVWGKNGENCKQYLSKGSQCAVHGRIETGSYKNRDGATIYTTDIIADNVEFLSPKKEERSPQVDDFLGRFEGVNDGMPF